jgi:hypothetical protein
MKRPNHVDRFPWLAAAGGAALVVIGAVALLRLPAPPEPAQTAERAALRFSQFGLPTDDIALTEELALQDPLPLFLPTQWNSGQADLRLGLRPVPTVRFTSFDPYLVFDSGPAIQLFDPPPPPADALQASLVDRVPSVSGLSQTDAAHRPLPERLLHFQISTVGEGRVVADVEARLSAEAGGEAGGPLRQTFWAPLEALVAIDAAGLVGQPALVVTSGSEAVDRWVLDFLVRQAHLGARLAPGFYRVLVGP